MASPAPERAQALTPHVDFVWRCLKRRGLSDSECDDATQQVFLIALDKIDRIEHGKERGYLFGVLKRVAIGEKRKRRPTSDVEVATPPTQMGQVTTNEKIILLDRILQSLPEPQREVFVLTEIEELPSHEVAEILNIPRGTVASRLRRARKLFDKAVKRIGDEEHAA